MYLIIWNSDALAQSLAATFISSVFLKIEILQLWNFQFEMDTQLPYCAVAVFKVRVLQMDFYMHSFIYINVSSEEDLLWWLKLVGMFVVYNISVYKHFCFMCQSGFDQRCLD